ncbi:MAG: arginine--tRNA ligase [Planctomycetota bacterium]|jgi:arginyl-tRNA synthetase|nr:arginine--tRNA ligase [Planctomycetota bacterium]
MPGFKHLAAELIAPLAGLETGEVETLLVKPPQPEMGDLGFPCFGLAKKLRQAPVKIASELAAKIILGPGSVFTSAQAVGPYVNLSLSPSALAAATLVPALSHPDAWGSADTGSGKTVVIEYSSPNIAKPLGVHHIRSTMLGAALSRLYRLRGWRVVEMNYLGDWGTTFGQLMVAYKMREAENPEQAVDVHALLQLYLKFHAEVDSDASLAASARQWFKRLEDGDPEAVRLWGIFRAESLKDLKKLYQRLGVDFPDSAFTGEAFFNNRMPATIKRLREKGLLVESQGAQVVDLAAFGLPPCLIIKTDGATIYATRDLASAEYRQEAFNFDLSLYVVANQQELHFRQIFKTLDLMGYPWAANCQHVKFGMLSFGPGVFGEGAATGSTRKGRVIFLEDVLDRAVEKARALILEGSADKNGVTDSDRLAEQVGVGAVVFSEFLQRRIKDVSFTWERALNLHGDSGPYLQYTHARLSSLLRRYAAKPSAQANWQRLASPLEKEVLIQLTAFDSALGQAVTENEPSLVATYLLELTAVFNRLFTDKERHRLISDDRELTDARMALVEGVRLTLARGLAILGLAAPDAM